MSRRTDIVMLMRTLKEPPFCLSITRRQAAWIVDEGRAASGRQLEIETDETTGASEIINIPSHADLCKSDMEKNNE
jgi:hypothetical protein